jgi:prepilin-type N-terminal cleavage/methylation domain-containing protein
MSRARARGFTLFELLVVICIVAVLAQALLSRVAFYQEQAERAAMEQVVAALQSALTLNTASLMTGGRERDAGTLANENPMNWLAKKPANYAGEFFDPAPRTVAPGNWVFDLKSRDLIYVIDRGNFFTPGKEGVQWIRFHVNLVHDYMPGEGGKKRQMFSGAVIEPVESYRWFDGPIV